MGTNENLHLDLMAIITGHAAQYGVALKPRKIAKPEYHIDYTVDLGVAGEVEVEIGYSMTRKIAAKTQADPDDCYEAYGGELDLMTIEIDGKDVSFLSDLCDFFESDGDFWTAAYENAWVD